MRGKAAPIGATRIAPNGYHYTKTGVSWILTARLKMIEHLGRPLADDEQVIYIDKDKLNLDISNLQIRKIIKGSPEKRLAQLEARRDEINAQIAEIQEEINTRAKSLS